MRICHQSHCRKSGFTLLEVILALAILAGALAVLGEVMHIASEHSNSTDAETQAQILAQTVMDELLSGYTPLADQSQQPMEVDDDTPWVCSITLGATEYTGLSSIEVLIEQDLEPQFSPAEYRLVCWVSDSEISQSETSEGGGTSGL